MSVEPAVQPERVRRLEHLIEISRVLSSTHHLEPLLQKIIETAVELTGSEAGSILLYDESSGELRFEAVPASQRDSLKAVTVPLDSSIAGKIFRSGAPIVIHDAQTDDRIYRAVDKKIDFATRSLLGVPLQARDQVIGVLEAVNKLNGQNYSDDDLETLVVLAAQAGIAIENARLLAALRRAYDEVSQLDKMKSNFVSIASHELRTPLGLILGHASYLRETAGAEASEQLDVVIRSALRLKSIIEDLANLSHLDRSQARLRLTQFGLDEVMLEAVEEARLLAQDKPLELRARLPGERILVNADRANVRAILKILIDNALKFTPAGGRVLVQLESHSDLAHVSIIDTGIGIPPDKVARIFDRFYQVESHMTRRHSGLGVGLAIAKAMVELHHGRIWCESTEGEGSKFTFILPLAGPADGQTDLPALPG